ncbi:MAG: hypothetical protein P1U58_11745 [Verrucomicrobiales bacterium]|nr:hypothetical protein [Verrucomicrobiales bacterium]
MKRTWVDIVDVDGIDEGSLIVAGLIDLEKETVGQRLVRSVRNDIVGRIKGTVLGRSSYVAALKAQREIVEEDAHGAWVDVDDREVDGEVKSGVHYEKEGYVILGKRFTRQGHAMVTREEPSEDGSPSLRPIGIDFIDRKNRPPPW